MRVLLVCTVYPPEIAPAGVMTQELAADLTAQGHDVTVLTGWPSYPKGELFPGYRRRLRSVQRANGYRVIRVWHTLLKRKRVVSRILWFFTFAVSSFFNILLCGRLDVVYAHSTPTFGPPLTWLACWLKRAKYVYGIYDIYPEAAAEVGVVRQGLVYRACRCLDTCICHRAASIPTLSEGLRRTLMSRGLPEEKIPVIPFWLDAEQIKPLARDSDWRRENGIEPGAFVVLYAGTIGQISGAGMMADVAAAMSDQPGLLFLFVGEGVAKDRIQQRSQELGLTNMRFFPFQPADRLSEVQATADVGVVTLLPGSGRNSIPSKMLGYMAAGRGVVASVDPESDTATAIQQAGCGLAVPCQDVQGMVQAIRRAMEPGVARQWGQAARKQFLARYSRSANTAKYIELLEQVCRTRT